MSSEQKAKKVLLTGATGLVGTALGPELVKHGYKVLAVCRKPQRTDGMLSFPAELVKLEEDGTLPDGCLKDVDAVINLAGEPIAGNRWTPAIKERIRTSRVHLASDIAAKVSQLPEAERRSLVVVGASATGFYGDRPNEDLTEDSPRGQGFLADVCDSWEEALKVSEDCRKVLLRIGVVLSKKGGALKEMMPLYAGRIGAALGSGRQHLPWIHIDDLVELILASLDPAKKMEGVYNAVAPNPSTFNDLHRHLAERVGGFKWLKVPALVTKIFLGEMSSMLLASLKVHPKRTLDTGFEFQFPDLKSALNAVFGDYKGKGTLYLTTDQWLPATKDEVWEFYSEAKNLERITPDFLGFKILGMDTPTIQKGSHIDYRISLRGLPLRWRTLIESWEPKRRFVDTQLKGPYQLWHHAHNFTPLGDGMLVQDVVQYRLPLQGWTTGLAHWQIKKDLSQIFLFRSQKSKEIFSNAK